MTVCAAAQASAPASRASHGRAIKARAADEPGLVLRVYELPEPVAQLPELLPGQKPSFAGVVPQLDLVAERGDFGTLRENFYAEISGMLDVPSAGEVAFRLISDDGAKLFVDDRLAIDHDGLHAPEPRDGSVNLRAGRHSLLVRYFQGGGGGQVALQWKLPGQDSAAAFATIPSTNLKVGPFRDLGAVAGPKRFVSAIRRGLPGDGAPLAGVHPGFSSEPTTVEQIKLVAMSGVRPAVDGQRVRVMRAPALKNAPSPLLWMPPCDGSDGVVSLAPLMGAPYKGQMIACCGGAGDLMRVFTEPVGDQLQGAVFRFSGGLSAAAESLMGTGDSSLYVTLGVGNKAGHDGPVPGPIRLKPGGGGAFEMLAVRAESNGLEIEFTQPLDPRVGWEADSYLVEPWPISSAVGNQPLRDGSTIPVRSASVNADRKRVFLEIPDLKPGGVVYLRLLPPCISESGARLWSSEAWYTLTSIPKDAAGVVAERPAREPQNLLTDTEKGEGWKLLFDGKSTAGWHMYGRKDAPVQGWQVMDGSLVRAGRGGDIATDESFDNFELKVEWRISPAGNSGIFFRSNEALRWCWETAPEMQVLDNAEHADGRNPTTSAGSNYALIAPPRDVTRPLGFYNEARIVARGNHVEYWLNGEKTAEYELLSPEWEELVRNSKFAQMPNYGREKSGVIVLQDHGDRVWFRNIKIRRLGEE